MSYSDELRARYAQQPFLLAPMAGVTDAAYRIMFRRRGARTAFSEMISVAGLAYASHKTWRLVMPADEEPQICIQLFGSKPDQFAQAVAAVQERVGDRLTLIDINMACPARKVVTKGEGSALMEDPDRAAEIVRAAVREARVPVTVKIRRGFAAGANTAVAFARVLEDAGAAAIAVHGRTAKQMYSGAADWSVVDDVARSVSVPVIGSGDVFSAPDAVSKLSSTAASAVFIARGGYGNPWICGDALGLLQGTGEPPVRDGLARLAALREHLGLVHGLLPLMSRARTFFAWYLKGMPHAAHWRGCSVRCTTYEDFLALCDDIEADLRACEEAVARDEPLPEPVRTRFSPQPTDAPGGRGQRPSS